MIEPPHKILQYASHRHSPLPAAPWIGQQSWVDLLLAHWALSPATVAALLPPELEVDAFEHQAWLSVVSYEMAQVGLRGMPSWARSRFPQLNLRTYVRYRGTPGIFFFSLDAASAVAVTAGRWITGLPYYRARMHLRRHNETIFFESNRLGGQDVGFAADYTPLLSSPKTSALDLWLTERYVFYAVQKNGGITAGDVCHRPWSLHDVDATIHRNTLATHQNLATGRVADYVNYSRGVDVLFWQPRYVASAKGGHIRTK